MASGSALNAGERQASFSLAAIFSLRFLGLSMIYPVFALYADRLPGATAFTIGVALGIYGLTQALLQLPFGIWSDRIGRRPVILAGLLLFAAGSVVAALATDIWGVILGRALQGTGAVGAVILALLADLTREEQRTRGMAIVGVSIGLSFALGVVAGPLLDRWIQLSGIFWFMAVLALAGVALLYLAVPVPRHTRLHRDTEAVPELLLRVLTDGQLLRLDIGIFVQHALLMMVFLGLPQLIARSGAASHQWMLYLLALLVSMVLMVPFIIYGERKARLKQVFLLAVAGIAVSSLLLASGSASLWLILPVMILFFTMFNLLEAILPSMVSRIAPAGMKGTAMGVYSSSQFLGIFAGGVLGGLAQQQWGTTAVFLLALALGLVWFLVSLGLRNPGHVATRTLALGGLAALQPDEALLHLKAVAGVLDVALAVEDGTVILKVDTQRLDQDALAHLLASG